MADRTCAEFLQWALPRLSLAWPGFRRVRRQVCRRIGRRVQDLKLPDLSAYRAYLEARPEEWRILDSLCWIPISRLLRDRVVFDRLSTDVLPQLAAAAMGRGARELRAWSAGCASGEEPYSYRRAAEGDPAFDLDRLRAIEAARPGHPFPSEKGEEGWS